MRDTFTPTPEDAARFEFDQAVPEPDDFVGDEPLACIACGGPLVPLGQLGRLSWFRCRDCGMDQEQHEAEVARDQDTDAMIADCFAPHDCGDCEDCPF